MRVAGIVVEYNPLHYGHIHHLQAAREESGADLVVAVMSGNVVQRGEFAAYDKFERARWAIKAGVDLVVELPGVLTLQNADHFAYASIALLHMLGADTVVFGSECGEVDKLRTVAELMRTNAYNETLRSYLKDGFSYPSAADKALRSLGGDNLPKLPNDILGVQYIQAIYRLGSSMRPLTIRRVGAGYYGDLEKGKRIQSASAIREAIQQSQPVGEFLPEYVRQTVQKLPINTLERYKREFDYVLASHTERTLKRVFSFEEGLENHMLKQRRTKSVDELIDSLRSRRYTVSKLKRSLMHALLRIEKEDVTTFDPPYVRVLGMNARGRRQLGVIKKSLHVPLISKLGRERHPYLDIELRISRLFELGVPQSRAFEREFDPLYID